MQLKNILRNKVGILQLYGNIDTNKEKWLMSIIVPNKYSRKNKNKVNKNDVVWYTKYSKAFRI